MTDKKRDKLEQNVVKAAMEFRADWCFGSIWAECRGESRRRINALDKACVMLTRHKLGITAKFVPPKLTAIRATKKGGTK